MGLFKSGKAKVDDLLTILVPALRWEIENEIRQRLAKEMESIVRDAADRVLTYGYKEAIKELSITVKAPYKEWAGLTDEEIEELANGVFKHDDFARAIEAKLKEKNNAV